MDRIQQKLSQFAKSKGKDYAHRAHYKMSVSDEDLKALRVPDEEAYRIVKLFWAKFYLSSESTFVSKEDINGTLPGGEYKKFVIWSVVIAVAGIVDGANYSDDSKITEKSKKLIETSYDIINRYKHKKIKGAYPASEYFDGNDDIYFDDDAQVGSALLFMYTATKDKKYLNAAIENLEFLITGYNTDPKKANGGGMFWSYGKTYINSITSSEAALVALRVLQFVKDSDQKQKYLKFATNCVNWVLKEMKDPDDNLIWDGITPNDSEENASINKAKYSYNSGTLLSALTYLYKYTNDKKWYEQSNEILESILNHQKGLFESHYGNSSKETVKKYWTDHTYFIQLVFEGLADYVTTYKNKNELSVPQENFEQIEYEIQRHLALFQRYSYDPKDGLYFSNLLPYVTTKEAYDRYIKDFGNPDINFQPDNQDRVTDDDTPVEDRKTAKTLIGVGSAARMWYQAGRILKSIDSKYFDKPYI